MRFNHLRRREFITLLGGSVVARWQPAIAASKISGLSRLCLRAGHRLRGWACRTRTCKRHFEKAIENVGRILIGLRNILGPETFRVRAARRLTCSFGWAGFARSGPGQQRLFTFALRRRAPCEEFNPSCRAPGRIRPDVPLVRASARPNGSMHPNPERLPTPSSRDPLDCCHAWSNRASCSRRWSLSSSAWPRGPS